MPSTKQLIKRGIKGSLPFYPSGHKILLEPIHLAERTVGGIIVPDVARVKTGLGIVKGWGPGKVTSEGQFIPMKALVPGLRVGTKILYGLYSAIEVSAKGLYYSVISCDDVIGVWPENEDEKDEENEKSH